MPRAPPAGQPEPHDPEPRGGDEPPDGVPPGGVSPGDDDAPTLAVSVQLPAPAAAILDLVDEIPPGAVRTYGDLAALTGARARYAGWVLSRYGHLVPWWRVVNASGALPTPLRVRAAARWREEGTPMRADGSVDLSRARVARP